MNKTLIVAALAAATLLHIGTSSFAQEATSV